MESRENCIAALKAGTTALKLELYVDLIWLTILTVRLGWKGGDVWSPVLFSLFINELVLEVVENGRHGASFINDYFELFILLLADDPVLLSETVIGLQTQLNSLQRASSSLQLKVNMSKSGFFKIIF